MKKYVVFYYSVLNRRRWENKEGFKKNPYPPFPSIFTTEEAARDFIKNDNAWAENHFKERFEKKMSKTAVRQFFRLYLGEIEIVNE